MTSAGLELELELKILDFGFEKSRSGKVDQRERQREERVADWAMVLIGNKERMWWRTASGRWLM